MAKSQLDQAMTILPRPSNLTPKNGKAIHNRAVAYYYKGDTAQAKQDIEQAKSSASRSNRRCWKTSLRTRRTISHRE